MTPKALKANIKAEIEAGKPVKQAVAIGYSVKKEAEKAKTIITKDLEYIAFLKAQYKLCE